MRYRILGATEAYDSQGGPLPVGGQRLRALLAALAFHANRTLGVNTLIDEVWADEPPADAPAALQALVGRLRRALGKDAVASDPGGYRLAVAPDDVDLHRFERLTREGRAALDRGEADLAARTLRDALALWRGPALADLPDRSASARPEARRAEAVRARIEADLLLGRAPDVVPELRELTTAQPYDEALRVLLIRALRDAGRGADALAVYEDARRALADGLGTDPGPELRSLHAELLGGPDGAGAVGSSVPSGWQGRQGRSGLPDGPERSGRPGQQPERAGQPEGPAPTGHSERPGRPGRPGSPGSPGSPGRPGQAERPERPERPERRGNIRTRLTSFVGREPELDAIRSDLHRARLVTLTGPGGSGKTRLAEEAAAGHPQAWLAELAPLDHPEAVPGAVVSALALRETVLMTSELTAPQDDPVALLVEYCAPRRLLLLLDNCEHVIDAAAELAETLLTRCPDLTILATSREPLGVPGESVRPVEPLPPDPAHRLFVERAMAVRPGFAPEEDAEAVAEICRRLDGLPLAIELAAARLRLLTPRQIADRLDDRFRLLTSGSRTVLPRQQTLRAVVDWSWDLLGEAERTVLREASVFAGGWDLEAAEAVCTGPATDLIGALVDKSLVVATPGDGTGDGGMRYRMLETIHEYATERIAEVPELLAAAQARHRAYFGALVAEAEPLLRSAEQLPWIQRLETELDNIRAALQRGLDAGDLGPVIRMALDTAWFWWLRNYRREGAEWLGRILRLAPPVTGLPEDDPLYWPWMEARLLHLFLVEESRTMGSLLVDGEARLEYVAQVRRAFDREGLASARFPGLIWPFTIFFAGGLPQDARPSLERSVANCRRYGGDWELSVILMFRTHMAVDTPGNLADVDKDLEELRMRSHRVGDRWLRAQVSSAAGEAAMARSHYEEARVAFEEALRLAYEVGAYAETSFLMARLAELTYHEGSTAAASKMLDEASTEAERYGVMESRAFVGLLRASMALDEGDAALARELYEEARSKSVVGTPPPQFTAALSGLEARIVALTDGPGAGLPMLTEALRAAVATQCSEAIVAALVDTAAVFLSELGEHARAARVLANATHLRSGFRRPARAEADARRVEALARTALGTPGYDTESAAGSALTPEDVVAELAAFAG
ncbi:AfsR/SARP family transcriptional regulator [Streptomyces luteocolor]|uniref:AfsR/SARP family transcriptional regulator n=1 Tax=Streptomyces luteocolor TaxID=285500 RepID=UPI000852C76F|nr:BTAD domain-containing putative transcriptional regulator [Streptomyces luteocolor]